MQGAGGRTCGAGWSWCLLDGGAGCTPRRRNHTHAHLLEMTDGSRKPGPPMPPRHAWPPASPNSATSTPKLHNEHPFEADTGSQPRRPLSSGPAPVTAALRGQGGRAGGHRVAGGVWRSVAAGVPRVRRGGRGPGRAGGGHAWWGGPHPGGGGRVPRGGRGAAAGGCGRSGTQRPARRRRGCRAAGPPRRSARGPEPSPDRVADLDRRGRLGPRAVDLHVPGPAGLRGQGTCPHQPHRPQPAVDPRAVHASMVTRGAARRPTNGLVGRCCGVGWAGIPRGPGWVVRSRAATGSS
jgi:hypothetical protein